MWVKTPSKGKCAFLVNNIEYNAKSIGHQVHCGAMRHNGMLLTDNSLSSVRK